MKGKVTAKKERRGTIIASFIVILIILGIVLGVVFIFQKMFPYQTHVAKLNAAFDAIQRDSLDPIGAVERKEVAAVADKRKEDCWDEICPNIQRSWFTPVAPGGEKQFLKDMVLRQGYTISYESSGINCKDSSFLYPCGIEANKDSLHVTVTTQEVGVITPPSKNVDPKRWLYTIIHIDER